ncbi:hypothetical protein [Thalassorhabdomicrobium marinisediminis]|nr:hypothetical protein [Thalassorhabdomicrobium marinisediminis]
MSYQLFNAVGLAAAAVRNVDPHLGRSAGATSPYATDARSDKID